MVYAFIKAICILAMLEWMGDSLHNCFKHQKGVKTK